MLRRWFAVREKNHMSLPDEIWDRESAAPEMVATVIDVANVTAASTALAEVPFNLAVDTLISPSTPPTDRLPMTAIEGCSDFHGRLVADVRFHPGVAAIHLAFNDHRPLVLSPDIVWMFLAQGFANHVNANAEDLRPQLVSHTGKLRIRVRRDDFVKGSLDNRWPEVFDEFTAQIRGHVGEKTHALLLPAFSTTKAVDRAAAQIVLLDAMQSYFDYEFATLCGIPQVVLEGTAADWQRVAERAEGLARFGLQWWTEPLLPILDEFVAAARGRAKAGFWQSIYKFNDGSGGPYVSGWITAFFPYLKDAKTGYATRRNPWLAGGGAKLQELLYPPEEGRSFGGPTTGSFPSGLARAPFRWEHLGDSYEMEFLAGFIGVRQDAQTLSLRPEIGWAVHEPASGEAILSARHEEEKRRIEERNTLTIGKGQVWKRKGMCPTCSGWIYVYTDEENPVHCGTRLVHVTARA
jgi:hypothetical protein